jgi:hypothetical protein
MTTIYCSGSKTPFAQTPLRRIENFGNPPQTIKIIHNVVYKLHTPIII